MKNLFQETRKLAKGAKEDHLTEFFAAALDIDEPFREAYASMVIAPFAEERGWAEPRIRNVETKKKFEGHKSCPDMALTLTDGRVIICEHKLEANETLAPASPETDELVSDPLKQDESQLRRYLKLPIHGLVFVRESLKPPAQDVLEHNKYIEPSNRKHFLWGDFYDSLAHGKSQPCIWLRDAFEKLGYTPPLPFVGDLSESDKQYNFAKLWTQTRSQADGLGWRVGTGAVVELYFRKPGADLVPLVWVCPRNERLLVRATPASQLRLSEVERRLRSVVTDPGLEVNVERRTLKGPKGSATVVEVWAPLREVLGETETAEQAETRLSDFVVPFLRAVS